MLRLLITLCLLATASALMAADPKPTDLGKSFLLRGSAGEMPSESGSEATVITKAESRDLGGKALEIKLVDSFGQKVAAVGDWSAFTALRLDMANPGMAAVEVELNLFHAGTKNFGTRVVVPIALKPGKNAISIPIAELKNSNGSAAELATVRRWYIANPGKPATLFVGDIWLEGGKGSGLKPYVIKTDPKRLERIKAAKLPRIEKPTLFDTLEADAIMAGVEIFPADNPWNTLIEDWPVHPNSAKMIASIGPKKPLRYNDDMAYVIVPAGQKLVDVKVKYTDESDPGPFPVPENVPIEGWPASHKRNPKTKDLTLDDVQRGKPTLDADRHAIVLDVGKRKLYEFYRLTRTDSGWTAEQSSVFDLSSNKLRPDGWTSSDAAGLPILPSIVRYDELQRGVIDHPLRFGVEKTRRAYVFPATHFASRLTDENLPRMGERFRLRKDFDTTGYSREVRIILEALKRYGMILADNGMDWGMSISADERIPLLHEELRKVRGSDFEVVTAPSNYVRPK